MKNINMLALILFFTYASILISSSNAGVQDFCIADLSAPVSPSGYPCKNQSTVTVNDFIFTEFFRTRKFSSTINVSATDAFVGQFPGLNGLGVSAVYSELLPGGTVLGGIISSENRVYYKTLRAGDLMVFPQGLLQFHLNAGRTRAKVIATFNSENPRAQLVPRALFSNDLLAEIVAKVSFLEVAVVERLKALLGGTN
ncbi:germin-like protein [Dioscorea cayenensis subsp. rotundata]|uniref:Germin-like protein n=1 Tax=Dioscorea cayennensis subsp. rotundata TaxID=55577 RepID=A0AB40CZZ6_DIOCR|nr:germin-like protein [Dioscorea cayenensis subsp. rotundata]